MEGKSANFAIGELEFIVLHEILPRLPVKSLIRFQLVSKNWLDYISKNPDFAKLHLKFSSSSLRRQMIINKYDRYFLLPQEQECSNKNDLERLTPFTSEADYSNIVDCCNGLVCLYLQYGDEIIDNSEEIKCSFGIWNPATRKCHEIDSPPGVHISMTYGFGYVSSLDDYKIVASFISLSGEVDDDPRVFRGFYVFSLRSGKWERLKGDRVEKTKLLNDLEGKGLWHEGMIYWPPIKGFDLTSGEFEEYTSMDWQSRYEYVELFRLKGSLALRGCTMRDNSKHSEFWALKDVDDLGSWQKLFCVNLARVRFITLSENGKCLVRQSKDFKLLIFLRKL